MAGRRIGVRACGSVHFAAGVPEFTFQDGSFTSPPTDTGTGIVTVEMPSGGLDAAQCSCVASPRATLAASQLTTIGITHTDDDTKVFTVLQEGAAGAVSALANVDFDFVFFGPVA